MAGMTRSFIKSLLNFMNSIVAMAGMAIVLYGLWMLWVWQHQTGSSPSDESDNSNLWFIYSFTGFGIVVCLITSTGHIAAETSNGCCLYLYLFFLFLLCMLEGIMTADVLLNHNWEEDLPADETQNLNELEAFVRNNFDFCKWIGLSVVSAQGLSFLLAVILKALGPYRESNYYETDDDDEIEASRRAPLLQNSPHSPYVVGAFVSPKH